MIRRPPRSTRTDTLFPTRRSSDLFTRDPQVSLDPRPLIDTLRAAAGPSNTRELDAHTLATRYFGDSILANMMMLGYAWQDGGIPLSEDAIMHALDLNGVAVQIGRASCRERVCQYV